MQLQVRLNRGVCGAAAKMAAAAVMGGCLLLTGCGKEKPSGGGGGTRLSIYVPCGMELAFMDLKKQFQEANPGVSVDLVLDNAGIIVKRVLEKGERPDLAVSPGTIEMDQLVAAGKIRPEDVHHFAKYELMLFTPRDNPAGVAKIEDLASPKVTSVALPDPETTSVGAYSREILKKLGLWEKVKPKCTFSEHPIYAYKSVARGKAQASFAYRSCPLNTAPEKLEYSRVRVLQKVPDELYGPAYGCIGILADSPNRELAERFIAFLYSPKGRAILEKLGVPIVTELQVFVPCGMTGPFFRVRRMFEAKHPTISLRLEFDRADALTQRIVEGGAVPDVHLSIGEVETRLLVERGLVDSGAPVAFGSFKLALCAHESRLGVIRSVQDLARPEVRSIVLTRPEESSVGFYVKQALIKLGLWDAVEKKIVWQPTIKDGYKLLSAGKVDAGFAYVGCPLPADPKKAEFSKVKAVQVLDDSLFGGATAYASVLKKAPHPEEARVFVSFLKQPEVAAELARVGLECRPVSKVSQ